MAEEITTPAVEVDEETTATENVSDVNEKSSPDQLLSQIRAGLAQADGLWTTPLQSRLIALFRQLDDDLVNGAPLPEDWYTQGERENATRDGVDRSAINDPNEQE